VRARRAIDPYFAAPPVANLASEPPNSGRGPFPLELAVPPGTIHSVPKKAKFLSLTGRYDKDEAERQKAELEAKLLLGLEVEPKPSKAVRGSKVPWEDSVVLSSSDFVLHQSSFVIPRLTASPCMVPACPG